ncbi:hypothetical protein M3Y95_01000900 [Aphelenchoides besseyi]|nr:hypothetical protein M3Y95_01000900 [Aphelenchoides besseyi]
MFERRTHRLQNQLVLILTLTVVISCKHLDEEKMRAIEKLKMNAKQYKRVENLHLRLYGSAMTGLLGAVGRETYKKLSPERAEKLSSCLENTKEYDLQSGAKCIVEAWESRLSQRLRKFGKSKHLQNEVAIESKRKVTPRLLKYRKDKQRRKRSYSNFINEPEEEKFRPKSMSRPPPLQSAASNVSLTSVGARLFLNGFRQLRNSTTKENADVNLHKLQKLIEARSEARQYKRTLADVVLDRRGKKRTRKTASERIKALMTEEAKQPLMERAYELLDTLEKHNQKLNLQALSPKFLSIVKDKRQKDVGQLLSPNLFPLYKDKDAILPIPDVLETAGLTETERTAFLDLIIEASGANDMIKEMTQMLDNSEARLLNDDINNVTNLIQKQFRTLHESLSEEQKQEMKEREFAFLNRSQLEMIYGHKGNIVAVEITVALGLMDKVPFDLDEYEKWRPSNLKTGLMHMVRSVANGKPLASAELSPRRVKRQFEPEPGVVVTFEPTILSPFVFAPDILEGAVLGPTILSPSLFSPEILAPVLLSPVIFSPSIGDPLILSPYILSPKMIGGEIFAAYILSPYAISPNILHPFVLSPLILSPHMMSPDILSPNFLNAIVLNPYFLSPAILTESAFVYDILSPSFLS